MAYKVKKGDTLSQIAKKKGVTLQALLTANPNIKNANQIRVGQSIKMPKAGTTTGNTKSKNPYSRMSQTMMNLLRSDDKGKQKTVTKALRREVTASGAQTSPTPKKAKDVKASKDGSKAAMDKRVSRETQLRTVSLYRSQHPNQSVIQSQCRSLHRSQSA